MGIARVLAIIGALSLLSGCFVDGSISSLDLDLSSTPTPATGTPAPGSPATPTAVCDSSIVAAYGGGTGTASDPYLICSVSQFNKLIGGNSDWSLSFKLTENLDLSGLSMFSPIGDLVTPFAGSFDGNNKTLSSLAIPTLANDNFGLFGVVSGAVFKDLVLVNFTINANGHSAVGALVGKTIVASTISNVEVKNVSISGGLSNVGGMIGLWIGRIDSGKVTDGSVTATGTATGGLAGQTLSSLVEPLTAVTSCSSSASISGGISTGGLIGHAKNISASSSISSCTATGSVTAVGDNVGGLVGNNEATVSSSHATGPVTATGAVVNVGGLLGLSTTGVSLSYATGAVNANLADQVGGLIGNCTGSSFSQLLTTQSYSTGNVIGATKVGGFYGSGSYCGASQSFARGDVQGTFDTGGFVGYVATTPTKFKFSYTRGKVNSLTGRAGGFAGYSKASISFVYAASVNGIAGVTSGGIVGENDTGGILTDVYWDSSVSGVAIMCGAGAGIGCNNGNAKTTAQMKDRLTYVGTDPYWNFIGLADGPGDIWRLASSSYPTLWWEDPQPSDYPIFSAGTGLVEDPFVISTDLQLNQVGFTPTLMNKHFRLEQDLSLAGLANYNKIGDVEFPFTGTFEGNSKTLSGLSLSKPGVSNLGLFGSTYSAYLAPVPVAIKNLNLTGFSVTGDANVGLLIGLGSATLSAVTVNGTVSGTTGVGGVVGNSLGVTMNSVLSSGTISGTSNVGGLIGYASSVNQINSSQSNSAVSGGEYVGGLVGYSPFSVSTSISQSSSTGTVSGTNFVGGLAGQTSSTIDSSYSSATVTGANSVGGLVGELYSRSAVVTESFSTGDVVASGSMVGGLVGNSDWHSAIAGSYSLGAVTGGTAVGGLVGRASGYLQESWSASNVTGDHEVGGLLGRWIPFQSDATSLKDCFARGNVTGRNGIGTQYLGGLIGFSRSQRDIKRVYFAGVITLGTGVTTQAAGGLIGYNEWISGFDILGAFWNLTLNPSLGDIGLANNTITNHPNVTASTTAEMKSSTPSIYTDAAWDFTLIWDVDLYNDNAGYPVLRHTPTVNWDP